MKCTYDGCQKDATHGYKMLLYARSNGVPAVAYLSVTPCDEHAIPYRVQVHSLEDNWEEFVKRFDAIGVRRPDRKLTKFETVPCDEVEKWFKRFKAYESAANN